MGGENVSKSDDVILGRSLKTKILTSARDIVLWCGRGIYDKTLIISSCLISVHSVHHLGFLFTDALMWSQRSC